MLVTEISRKNQNLRIIPRRCDTLKGASNNSPKTGFLMLRPNKGVNSDHQRSVCLVVLLEFLFDIDIVI